MPHKKAVILQSAYIPWKGYFDLINEADVFIFLEDVQFTTRDWRSRNKIKTEQGTRWLTVPAGDQQDRLIREVEVPDQAWKQEHKNFFKEYYAKAPYFEALKWVLDIIYDNDITNLSSFNIRSIIFLSYLLGVRNTGFLESGFLQVSGRKTEKLISLLRKADADVYISGPSGKDYLDEEQFAKAGIELQYYNYEGYPEYPQLYPPFEHGVTILDLLFNTGPDAPKYLKSFQAQGKNIISENQDS